jgi:hypothetical protein
VRFDFSRAVKLITARRHEINSSHRSSDLSREILQLDDGERSLPVYCVIDRPAFYDRRSPSQFPHSIFDDVHESEAFRSIFYVQRDHHTRIARRVIFIGEPVPGAAARIRSTCAQRLASPGTQRCLSRATPALGENLRALRVITLRTPANQPASFMFQHDECTRHSNVFFSCHPFASHPATRLIATPPLSFIRVRQRVFTMFRIALPPPSLLPARARTYGRIYAYFWKVCQISRGDIRVPR